MQVVNLMTTTVKEHGRLDFLVRLRLAIASFARSSDQNCCFSCLQVNNGKLFAVASTAAC